MTKPTVCTTTVNVIQPPIDPDAVKAITFITGNAVEGDNVVFSRRRFRDGGTLLGFCDGRTLTEAAWVQ